MRAPISKPHTTLSPTTNILLIFAWAAVVTIFLFVVEPHAPITLAAVGAVLGVVGGVMQHLSLAQATTGFSTASSLLKVRSAFTATAWGRRYIRFLYVSKIVLIAFAFIFMRESFLRVIFGYLVGYFSLMFVREVVTLRDTFILHRLSTNASRSEPKAV